MIETLKNIFAPVARAAEASGHAAEASGHAAVASGHAAPGRAAVKSARARRGFCSLAGRVVASLALALMAALAARAAVEPEFDYLRATAFEPWGVVKVEYSLKETVPPEDFMLSISAVGKDESGATTVRIGAEDEYITGDISAEAGPHEFYWNLHDQGVQKEIPSLEIKLSFIVQKVAATQLWEGGPLWTESNVGAEKPEDVGTYFWWGDTVGCLPVDGQWEALDGSTNRFNFGQGNTTYTNPKNGAITTFRKKNAELQAMGMLSEGRLAPEYDAAKLSNEFYRMPTSEEAIALGARCQITEVVSNGVAGILFSGKEPGYTKQSIFMPYSGSVSGVGPVDLTNSCSMWTSTPSESDYCKSAFAIYCNESCNAGSVVRERYRGMPIRPVVDTSAEDKAHVWSTTVRYNTWADGKDVKNSIEVPYYTLGGRSVLVATDKDVSDYAGGGSSTTLAYDSADGSFIWSPRASTTA